MPADNHQVVHDLIMVELDSSAIDFSPQRATFVAKTRGRLEALWQKIPERYKTHTTGHTPPPWICVLLYVRRSEQM